MTVSWVRDWASEDAPCQYNGSRLWFRGPQQSLQEPYVACIGGCGTLGPKVPDPYPARLAQKIGMPVVNLGVANAGLEAYLRDPGALSTVAQARMVVVELSGIHNVSNRFYSVHPRRNDRFVRASETLTALYPEIDLTEIHFTRHLLTVLKDTCPDRFSKVVGEVQTAWKTRLRSLLSDIDGKALLLWFSPNAMPERAGDDDGQDFELADKACIAVIEPFVAGVVDVVAAPGTAPLWFENKAAHEDAAQAILPQLKRHQNATPRAG